MISNKISFKHLSKITHILILILIAVNVVTMLGLPFILDKVFYYNIFNSYGLAHSNIFLYRYVLILLYVTGSLALFILNNLRLIFYTCYTGDPFVKKNVTILVYMAISTLIISICFIMKLIFYLHF